MKKITVIVLAFVMVFAFAACGGGSKADLSDSKYLGEWVASGVSIGDESGDLDGGVWTLTLNGDGTGKFVSTDDDGKEEVSEITWELTDDGFKTKGDTKLTFKDDGDNIVTKLLGVNLIFVRGGGSSTGDDDADEYGEVGYSGNDPAEYAVYEYLADVIADQYADAQYSLAYGTVVDRDDSNDQDVLIKGDFWVDNYDLEGDTLNFVSGGSHPGCFHLKKEEDGDYEVVSFDQVGDGSEFEPTAKEIFGDKFDEFMKVNSDDTSRNAKRLEAVSTFVKAKGIAATKYQDPGWDPVELDLG